MNSFSKNIKKVLFLAIFLFIITVNCTLITEDWHASAHPQPLVIQEFLFKYGKESLDVDLKLRIDAVVVDEVFPKVDKNSDGNFDEAELKIYFEQIVKPNLTSRFNNRDLKYEITGFKTINKNEIRSLDDYAEVRLKTIDTVINQSNSMYVKYEYRFIPNDAFGDNFVYNDNIFETPGIERVNLESTDPSGIIEYSTDFKFKESVSSTNPSTTKSEQPQGNFLKDLQNLSTDLTNRVRVMEFNNPLVFLTAFGLLFVAGALHALTPGHGKSMVAAFLVAKKQSKFADVLILGLSITLAHTAAIYVIGFALLALRQTAYAQNIVYAVEKLSAWLFLGLGLLLLRNGWKAYKHFQSHQHEDHHHHDRASDKFHKHKDSHTHSHNHEEHHHDHGHHHAWEDKNLKIKNRWDLFYAGISGGIVPCLDALSILFVFNSLGRVDLGLILVFIFSLGLAGAIILLGATLLYGKDKLKLEERIGARAEYLLPILSGLFVAGFGVFYILTK